MVYWRIIRKSYIRNLQYRVSHLINNVASAIFGFVYMAIWFGVLDGRAGNSPYDQQTMAQYITLTQSLLWVTTFHTPGLGIQNGVRTGAVSTDLMRPISYFLYVISMEFGKVVYSFLYRFIPVGLILGCIAGFSYPQQLQTYLWFLLSLLFAVFLGLLLFYITGISSFWTTEIRWSHYILITLIFGLGGQMIPVELLPGFLGQLSLYLPFSGMLYTPAMIFLERIDPSMIARQAGWAIALTCVALFLTGRARRKVEVQGG